MSTETSNLVTHAKRELARAGYTADVTDRMDRDIYVSTMVIVQAFASVGHSGYSAAAHAYMVNQLLQFKSLGPITDNPDEWQKVSLDLEREAWQNVRESSLFSEDGGKTYYDIDEFRRGWRRKLFGLRGKMYTSAPHQLIDIKKEN